MTNATPRPGPWMAAVGGTSMLLVLAAIAAWRFSLAATDQSIQQKKSSLRKLALSGGVPPNQEVFDYLKARQAAAEQRYQQSVKAVTTAPPAGATGDDAQLYFRERSHDLQRTLERLAKARNVPVPESLGLPKELPPPEAVGPLLVQLTLVQEAATLIFDQGPVTLSSLKLEDPEAVPKAGSDEPLLLRLPVRVRLSGSMPQVLKAMAAFQRAEPLVDVRGIRVSPGSAPDALDAELVLARYLLVPGAPAAKGEAGEDKTAGAKRREAREP